VRTRSADRSPAPSKLASVPDYAAEPRLVLLFGAQAREPIPCSIDRFAPKTLDDALPKRVVQPLAAAIPLKQVQVRECFQEYEAIATGAVLLLEGFPSYGVCCHGAAPGAAIELRGKRDSAATRPESACSGISLAAEAGFYSLNFVCVIVRLPPVVARAYRVSAPTRPAASSSSSEPGSGTGPKGITSPRNRNAPVGTSG
jgi:hypothetical protein